MTTRRSKNVKVMVLGSPSFLTTFLTATPLHYALPVFLDEPEDTFVVKNKAAEQECREWRTPTASMSSVRTRSNMEL